MSDLRETQRPAQALLEVMLLFTLFAFLLSVLLNMGLSFAENQKFMMQSFRDAIKKATTDDVRKYSLGYAAEYFKQTRMPDASSSYQVSTMQEVRSGASIYRTPYMQYAQSLDKKTAPRRNIVVGSEDANGKEVFTDIGPQVNSAAGISGNRSFSGFVTSGYKTFKGLPLRVDIDGIGGADNMCVIQQWSDPDDNYPKDGILWTWVAVCLSNYKAGDDSFVKPLFLKKSCQLCGDDDYESWTTYVSDEGEAGPVCHPSSSADSLTGSKDLGDGAGLTANVNYYFQAAYDPSVPLTSGNIVDACADGYCPPVVLGDGNSTTESWLTGKKWVRFASASANNNNYYLLPTNLRNRPFLTRGMTIWVPFWQFDAIEAESGITLSLEEKRRLWKDEPLLYNNCVAQQGTDPDKMTPCGATFSVLALEGDCDHDAHTFELNDGQSKFYSGQITGLVLSHAAWGDIDGKAVTEGVPEQGVKDSRVRTDITKMSATTTIANGTVTAEKSVDMKETVTRGVMTSPYGDLQGKTFDVKQTRTVSGKKTETFDNE